MEITTGRWQGCCPYAVPKDCSAALAVHDKRTLTPTLTLILTLTLTPTPTLTRRAAARAAATPLSGWSASAASPACVLFRGLVLRRMGLDCRAARPTTRTAWRGAQGPRRD